jgi:ribosomal protein S12 methylthiotransferase
MREKSYFLVSLGCAKNTVDSDSMAMLLERDGYRPAADPSHARVLIVNTCGFIQTAREESLQVLGELAQNKLPGQLLVAAGCMTERYRESIAKEVKGIDGFIGTRRWMDILDLVTSLRSKKATEQYHLPESPTVGRDEKGIVRASIQGGSAYLKIADGCRRPCAFCAIPLIKGTTVSRPLDVILDEAEILQDNGIKELILIAQDTTDYGYDLGMKDGLSTLLEKLLPRVPAIPWVRLLYSFPGYVTNRLIDIMSSSPQILNYLDIPLQHADGEILKKMNRPSDIDWVYKTVSKMRSAIPDLAIRSTFIVGYPGETEKEFSTLLKFIEEMQFDHVGAFTFSFEQGTSSEPFGDPVPEDEKQVRLSRLMKLQETISLRRNQALIGKRLDVLIEGTGDGISIGRSYRDAPEIDGLVIIDGELTIGEIQPVLVSGAMTHDLSAVIIK